MNYEEQILELKKRIEVLEKAEHKRIVKRRTGQCVWRCSVFQKSYNRFVQLIRCIVIEMYRKVRYDKNSRKTEKGVRENESRSV